jgi:hypothetical protein
MESQPGQVASLSVGGKFSGFDFASGELSLTAQMVFKRTLSDEHLTLIFDQGAAERNGRTQFGNADWGGWI